MNDRLIGKCVGVVGNIVNPPSKSYTHGATGRITKVKRNFALVQLDNTKRYPVPYLYRFDELAFTASQSN